MVVGGGGGGGGGDGDGGAWWVGSGGGDGDVCVAAEGVVYMHVAHGARRVVRARSEWSWGLGGWKA